MILFRACRYGNTDCLKLLINNGANINVKSENGDTPLIIACKYNKIKIIKLLLKHNVDVNTQNNYGSTPLHQACDYPAINLLLGNKADVHIKDIYGNLPLHIACFKNNLKSIKLLLNNYNDININIKNHAGSTPLHCLCETGYLTSNTKALRFLINSGADINNQDIKGCTPLHMASSCNRYKFVKILLLNGAELDIVNNGGFTALPIAQHYHCTPCIKLLQPFEVL